MIAVIGGGLTAIAWAFATLSATRAARTLGPWSTSGWVLLIGLAVSLPLVLWEGVPESVEPAALGWLAIAGFGYVGGMLFNYSALAGGKVPVAASIVSTEGALTAAIAVIAGEAVSTPLVLLLALLTGGIFLTALEPPAAGAPTLAGDDTPGGPVVSALGRRRPTAMPTVALAIAAALAFAGSLFAAGRASEGVPLSWVAAAGRVVGVALVTLPLLVTGRLRMTREALPFVAFSGVVEVVGYYSFAWGARDSIAITAVLASQSAVLAGLLAHVLGDRISRRQWLGVAIVAGSVTGVTLARLGSP